MMNAIRAQRNQPLHRKDFSIPESKRPKLKQVYAYYRKESIYFLLDSFSINIFVPSIRLSKIKTKLMPLIYKIGFFLRSPQLFSQLASYIYAKVQEPERSTMAKEGILVMSLSVFYRVLQFTLNYNFATFKVYIDFTHLIIFLQIPYFPIF